MNDEDRRLFNEALDAMAAAAAERQEREADDQYADALVAKAASDAAQLTKQRAWIATAERELHDRATVALAKSDRPVAKATVAQEAQIQAIARQAHRDELRKRFEDSHAAMSAAPKSQFRNRPSATPDAAVDMLERLRAHLDN